MREVEITEYKEIVLSVLARIDAICRENGLRYMLFYGTLIGAARHRGFIPWDDDVDIVMYRPDYYKLMDLIQKGEYGLRFLAPENTPDMIYPYGKVCDTTTLVKEKNFRTVKGYGAFVDVFPLDYMPDDAKEREKYCRECRKLIVWITHSSRTGYEKSASLKTNWMRRAAFLTGKLMNTGKLVNKLNRKLIDFDEQHGPTSFVGIPWGYYADKLYPAELLRDWIEMDFEGHRFLAPKEYDRLLRMRYGDYMKLPPEEERVYLHSLSCRKLD